MKPTTCHWCGEDYNDCNRCTHRGVYVEPDELARLRRMADAYAKQSVTNYSKTEWRCDECGADTWDIGRDGKVRRLHTATCDVAIHLDLPLEKGDGE